MTSSISNEVTSSISNEVTSAISNEVTSSISDEVTSSISNEVTYSINNEVTSSISNEVTSSKSNEVTYYINNEVTSSIFPELYTDEMGRVEWWLIQTCMWIAVTSRYCSFLIAEAGARSVHIAYIGDKYPNQQVKNIKSLLHMKVLTWKSNKFVDGSQQLHGIVALLAGISTYVCIYVLAQYSISRSILYLNDSDDEYLSGS